MKTTKKCRRKRFNWVKWLRHEFVVMITLYFFFASTVLANPLGGQVVNGNVQFNKQGNTLTITNSPNSIINWGSFSIKSNETTRFIQQNSASSVLNRIIGQDPSVILGGLLSNGRVLLINPNGIIFGQGSRVDVNGLIASTLNLSNQDFLSGKYNFTAGAIAGAIQNQGTITTPSGGKVYLIAPDIKNSGIIKSPKGDVLLAAGHSVQLVDSLNPEIAVVVSAPADKAVNLGKIIAQSGTVGIYGGLISQKGIINADSAVAGENGKIFFKATKDVNLKAGSLTSAQGGNIRIFGGKEDGTVKIAGTIDASAPHGGDGGFIETSAAHVKVADSARVTTLAPYGKAGTWLIDPYDFTLAASGGDMTGDVLSAVLALGSVTIDTNTDATVGNGDIFVNDTVSWSANKLTLNAYRNIEINQTLNGSGTAQLAFYYGQGAVNAGNTATYSVKAPVNLPAYSTFSTKLGSDGTEVFYTVINSLGSPGSTYPNDLQGMNMNLGGNYVLGSNIDASGTSSWNPWDTGVGYYGFNPIGNSAAPFTGRFDGLGHTITGLYINRSTTDYVGLFGYANSATIQNVGMVNVNVTGQNYIGGLVGYNNYGSISNSYSTGSVNGTSSVGGLVGKNDGSISDSHSTGSVNGTSYVGGLVGYGYNNYGSISNSYSTGSVNGTSYVGGLVGENNGSISDSHSTGSVNGTSYVGGLVGYASYADPISNSYSTGSVNGTIYVGGLVGYNSDSITDSYSMGNVSGTYYVGGLVGYNDGTISNSHYDIDNVLIKGSHYVTEGGLYTAQFNSWLTNGKTLNIATYLGSPDVNGYYSIGTTQNLKDLLGFVDNTTYKFKLTADLNLAAFPGWYIPTFYGAEFNGNNHTLSNLSVNMPFNDVIGFIGWLRYGSTLNGLNLISVNVTGASYVGGLVGSNDGSIINSSSAGTVSGDSSVGGLVGFNYNASITNSYSNCTVSGNSYVGGLVGENNYSSIINSYSMGTVTGTGIKAGGLVGYNTGSISNSYSTAAVNGNSYVGGLVGYNGGSIDNSYSMGTVIGSGYVGGLVGENYGGISNSYSTGAVNGSGGNVVGGLVGYNGGSISNSYSTGTVSGGSEVGGLVGDNSYGTITNSYSTGAVTGTGDYVGGLVGYNGGTVNNSFWDIDTSGQTSSDGGTGMHTADFMNQANFTSATSANGGVNPNWNLETTWWMSDGNTRPFLQMEYSTTITNAHQLQLMAMNPAVSYTLGANIDMAELTNPSGMWNTTTGFVPIGDSDTRFTGTFDGLGHTITGLYINRPSTNYVGLFGLMDNTAIIQNVGLVSANITGFSYVGGLVGKNYGTIINSFSMGSVISTNGYVGGLVGYNDSNSTVKNSYSTASVSGAWYVGGIVGYSDGSIDNSYSMGSVIGTGYLVGGLVGYNDNNGAITNSYSTGHVTGGDGSSYVAGLVGYNSGSITNSYSTASVYGSLDVGGLVGENSGSITNSYSAGSVTGSSDVGGLVGLNSGSISNSFWNIDTSGQTLSDGGTGLYAAQMMTMSSFSGWCIANTGGTGAVWRIYEGNSYPLLRSFLTPLMVTADDVFKTYNGLAWSGLLSNVSYSVPGADTSGHLLGITAPYGNSRNVGIYAPAMWSDQQGYDISYVNGTLTVNPAAITVTAQSNTRPYDGTTTAAAIPTVTGTLYDTASFSEIYDNRNAGYGKTLTPSGTVNDGNGGNNYTITYVSNATGVINPEAITVTAQSNTRPYDGTTTAAAIPTVTSGTLYDTASFSEIYDNRNAGHGKTLTPSGTVNDGNGGNNYTITYVSNATGVINPEAITVTAQSNTRPYDGTTTAAAIPTVTGTLYDTASFSEIYDNRNAGHGKTLTPSGTVNDGNGGNNYTITYVSNGTGVINPEAITVTAQSNTRPYDGTTTAAAIPTVTSGTLYDTASFSEIYDNRNAGHGKTLTPSGTVNDGNGGNNYTITYVSNATGVINPEAITVTAQSNTKPYDGTTTAAAIPTVTSGTLYDTASFSEIYDNRNAGHGKTLTPSGTVNDGNGGNNYTITYVSNATGVINPEAITVTAQSNTKTYDGTISAAAIPTVTGTLYDTANFSEIYNDKNAGSGKILTPSGTVNDGNGGNNYTITYVSNDTGVINPAPLNVTANADSKTYDGLAYSGGNGVTYSGFVNGETSTVLSGLPAYSGDSQGAINPGIYTITPGGLTANNGNYTISYYDGALTVNQSTAPQQNDLYVTVLDSNGTTTTTIIVAGDGSGGSSDSDTDKDKDKKGNSKSQKEGQDSGSKQQALPYCN